MKSEKTYIDLCLDGLAHLDEIDDYIQKWHNCESSEPLYSFLGFNREEYKLWIENPKMLRYIVNAKKTGCSIGEVILNYQSMPLAARVADPVELNDILLWLKSKNFI